jgi:chromosome segregation ATPase
MARQKITVESRLRTENTFLAEEVRKLEQLVEDQNATVRAKNSEIASRNAAIAELQYQLRSVRTQLGLANEQCEDYRVAAAVNARLMTTFGELNEKLRYPPAERPDAKARPE